MPVAIDVWYEQRRKDAAGEFFFHVVNQGRHKGKSRMLTRQGLYCFTPHGMLLADSRHCSPHQLRLLLTLARAKFRKIAKGHSSVDALKADEQYDRDPPPDGLVADVFGKILLRGAAKEHAARSNAHNDLLSRDHLWITQSEIKAMAPTQLRVGLTYPVPPSLAIRIARFHLVDNIRGEPPMWTVAQIRALSMTVELIKVQASIAIMKLKGFAHLATSRRNRTYTPAVVGEVVYDANKGTLTRFDILALGDASGEGRYNKGSPQGKFSLAIAFTLAQVRQVINQIPPQGARRIQEYLVAQSLPIPTKHAAARSASYAFL